MEKRNVLFSAIVLLAIASIVYALVPPPPANQNIGIYDTSVNQQTESTCRNCHTSGVPDRHHNLVPTGEYECMDCHPIVTGPNGQELKFDRNCVLCHNGTAWYANPSLDIGRPHHNTTEAQDRDCKACHGGFVDNYNDGHYIPTYPPSLVTPDTSFKIENATSGRYWGGCEACHQEDLSATPDILHNYETHHAEIIDVTDGYNCNWCHDDSSQLNIRKCEECHSVATLHNIQYDYTNTTGQLGYGHIGANWDCNGCHAFWDAGAAPMQGAIIPDIASITPNKLSADTPTTVTIAGTNFLSGGAGGAYTSHVVIDGTTVLAPVSITDSEFVVEVPALAAGVHTIKVVKTGDTVDKPSKLSALTVVVPVDVVSATLSNGEITIDGTGFGLQPDPLFKDLGVFITHKTKGKTTTFRADVVSWSDTQIVVSSGGASSGDLLTVKALYGDDSETISWNGASGKPRPTPKPK